MTREIPLSQGKVALVDDEVYEWLNQWKWFVCGEYAVRTTNRKTTLMHRQILEPRVGFLTDHINGNGLDNRRCNLREATYTQNTYNSRKHRLATSQYRGVAWQKDMQKWVGYLTVNGKRIHLGSFNNEIDAAQAFDAAARQYHGEFARLNFPEGL